jgi:cadmium resistance protein CadD (predicted permease)
MTLSTNNLLLSIIVFALNILILGLLAFVYIILGIMVLLESGTVSKILSFL